MAYEPLRAQKGGYLQAPELTDSLLTQVCNQPGLGCQILLRMSPLVPYLPLKRRLWYDSHMGDTAQEVPVLAEDQRFDAEEACRSKFSSIFIDFHQISSIFACWLDPKERMTARRGWIQDSLGISVNILGISEVNFIDSYWSGHVRVELAVSPTVYLRDWGHRCTEETRAALRAPGARLLECLLEEQRRWARAEGEMFGPVEGSGAENFMRFLNLGIVNRHTGDDTDRPQVSGSEAFWWEEELLRAEWTVGAKWYHEPNLWCFPFDTNELSVIFWTRQWRRVGVLRFGASYGLGTKFTELEVLGFRGDSRPWRLWSPYHCDCNVVPNRGRPDFDVFFYGRFWVRRKPFYFVAALLFPTGVVAFMGSAAVLIAANQAPNGIVLQGESPLSLIAGLMLTMSAMKFSYADSLPKLGYLTMLDLYIVVSFLLLSLAALVVVLLPEELLQDLHAAEAPRLCLRRAFGAPQGCWGVLGSEWPSFPACFGQLESISSSVEACSQPADA